MSTQFWFRPTAIIILSFFCRQIPLIHSVQMRISFTHIALLIIGLNELFLGDIHKDPTPEQTWPRGIWRFSVNLIIRLLGGHISQAFFYPHIYICHSFMDTTPPPYSISHCGPHFSFPLGRSATGCFLPSLRQKTIPHYQSIDLSLCLNARTFCSSITASLSNH